MKSFYFSQKWRSSWLPIEFFCVTPGFQWSSYCLKPMEVLLAFFLYHTFCRYSVWRKSYSVSLATKLWLLQRSRNQIILFFSKMTVFRASYRILLCNSGLPTVFLLCEARGNPSGIFYVIHFVDTQFRENISVFPWHKNYGFWKDREMKSFYFSPKWRSSRLPIEFFSLTAGFQRSSYCVKPVEVRLEFFLCDTFCRYSVSGKS